LFKPISSIRRTAHLLFSGSWDRRVDRSDRRSQQQALLFDQVVVRGRCIGKARIFDGARNPAGVNHFGVVETLGDEQL